MRTQKPATYRWRIDTIPKSDQYRSTDFLPTVTPRSTYFLRRVFSPPVISHHWIQVSLFLFCIIINSSIFAGLQFGKLSKVTLLPQLLNEHSMSCTNLTRSLRFWWKQCSTFDFLMTKRNPEQFLCQFRFEKSVLVFRDKRRSSFLSKFVFHFGLLLGQKWRGANLKLIIFSANKISILFHVESTVWTIEKDFVDCRYSSSKQFSVFSVFLFKNVASMYWFFFFSFFTKLI